jgi:uncharacterized membrane protein
MTMRRIINWIWNQGILSTFLTGLFAVLPLVLTVAIVVWVVRFLYDFLGKDSFVGARLQAVGMQLTDAPLGTTVAYLLGWAIVLAGVWALGALLKTTAKNRVEKAFNSVVDRIPIVNSVYSTATQLVGMVRKSDDSQLSAMSAVYCTFGQPEATGLLALLTSPDVYRFAGRDCHIVYLPTSPVPMTGGIVFVPVEACTKVAMTAEEVMRVYFSLGILASQVVPEANRPQIGGAG